MYRKGVEFLNMTINDLDKLAGASDYNSETKHELREKIKAILNLK
jgi:hypothetical protein